MPYKVTEYDNGAARDLGLFADLFSASEIIKYNYNLCVVPIYGPELQLKYNYLDDVTTRFYLEYEIPECDLTSSTYKKRSKLKKANWQLENNYWLVVETS